jgi:hypothetical protein
MLARKSLRTAAAVRIAAADRAAAAVCIAAAGSFVETPHPASLVVGEGAPAALSHTTGETKLFPLNNSKPLSPFFFHFRYNFAVNTAPLLIEFPGNVNNAIDGNCANAPSNSHP